MLRDSPLFNPFLSPFINAEDWSDRAEFGRRVRLKSDSFVNGRIPKGEEDPFPNQTWLEAIHEQPLSSWRRVLLAQPTVDEFSYWRSKHQNYYNGAENCTANSSKGVRVGMVHELLYNHLKHCVACPTWLGGVNQWAWDADVHIDYLPLDSTGWEMFNDIKDRSIPLSGRYRLEENVDWSQNHVGI